MKPFSKADWRALFSVLGLVGEPCSMIRLVITRFIVHLLEKCIVFWEGIVVERIEAVIIGVITSKTLIAHRKRALFGEGTFFSADFTLHSSPP
jgi:hypothetical protein